jgi:hypothetical protein
VLLLLKVVILLLKVVILMSSNGQERTDVLGMLTLVLGLLKVVI